MKRILSQCRKELAQFQRDRFTLALAFLLPFISLILFGFAIRLESKNIPLFVQDFDVSPLSALILSGYLLPINLNQLTIIAFHSSIQMQNLKFKILNGQLIKDLQKLLWSFRQILVVALNQV